MAKDKCAPRKLYQTIADITKGTGNAASRFSSKTAREAQATAPEVIKGSAFNPEGIGSFYQTVNNKEQWAIAEKYWARNPGKMEKEVTNRVFAKNRKLTSQDVMNAQKLILEHQKKGEFESASNLIDKLSGDATNMGQAIQALAMYGRLTPQGAVKYAESIVEQAKEGKKPPKEFDHLFDMKDKVVEAGKVDADTIDKAVDTVIKPSKPSKPRQVKPETKKVKKEKVEEEPVTTAEQLKRKVLAYVAVPKDGPLTPEQMMVRTLFNVAKQELPKRGKKVPTDVFNLLHDAMKNKNEYLDVYKQAQKLVLEHYQKKGDQDSIDRVNAYLKDYIAGKPYSQKQVSEAVNKLIKESKFDLKALVKEHYLDQHKGMASLEVALQNKLGLTSVESKILMKDIAKEIDMLTGKARRQRLDQIFKVIPAKKRATLVNRIIEIANLGGLRESSYRHALEEKFKIPHVSEEKAQKLFNMASELQHMTGINNKKVASALLVKEMFSGIEPSIGRKIGLYQTMSMLLNPVTAMRNIAGNEIFHKLQMISQGLVGVPIDWVVSLKTGQRAVMMPRFKEMPKSFIRGAKEGIRDVKLGIDTSGVGTQYDIPFTPVFKNKVLAAGEKLLGYELRVPDRAYYVMSYEESILNQLAAQKASKGYKGEPRITDEMVAQAHHEALYNTFQDESVAAKAFIGLKKTLNLQQDFGLGDFVLKFPKTPANLISRAFAYTPAGLVKVFYEVTKPSRGGVFNQREFVNSLSRAITGTVGVGVMGYWLGSLGLATGEREDDRDIVAVQRKIGKGPYRINATGMYRFALSAMNPEAAKPQEDDLWVSYDWAQPIAAPLAAAVNIAQGVKNKDSAGKTALNVASGTIKGIGKGIDTIFQQPLMQGLQVLYGARNTENQRPSISAGVTELAAGAAATFIPTALSKTEQLLNNTVRETYDPNVIVKGFNKVIVKIPGVARILPEKRDVFGEPMERYQEGSNNLFNVLLNPAFISKMKSDPVGDEVLRIFEATGETIQAPRIAAKKFTIINEDGTSTKLELNGRELSQYQEEIGKKSVEVLKLLVDLPEYKDFDDESKAELMQQVLTSANTAAKYKLFNHRPSRIPTLAQDMIDGLEDYYIEDLFDSIDKKNAKIDREE